MRNEPRREAKIRGNQSQAKFSKVIGVAQPTYSAWELGKKEPGIRKLIHIAKTLGVSTDWLLGLSDTREGVPVMATDGSAVVVQSPGANASASGNLRDENIKLRGQVEMLMSILGSRVQKQEETSTSSPDWRPGNW